MAKHQVFSEFEYFLSIIVSYKYPILQGFRLYKVFNTKLMCSLSLDINTFYKNIPPEIFTYSKSATDILKHCEICSKLRINICTEKSLFLKKGFFHKYHALIYSKKNQHFL